MGYRRKEMDMIKRRYWILIGILVMSLPLTALSANIPAKVYENGVNGPEQAVSGVKIQVLGGFKFKAVLSSGESDAIGGCVLRNVPVGKEVVVKLSKPGYVTQYDVKNFSEREIEEGVILWVGSEANLAMMYGNIGEGFDAKKSQVYLEINNELTGAGMEGVQFTLPSGTIYDLGQGDYLIANAEGASLTLGIRKDGYDFDIQSVTIPLFPGGMTQSYVSVQSGGSVYEGAAVAAVTSVQIFGFIKSLTNAPISGASVAFTNSKGQTVRPTVRTDKDGFYKQTEFPSNKLTKITPTKAPFKFRAKNVFVGKVNKQVDFKEVK
jgi:hypothetical protein